MRAEPYERKRKVSKDKHRGNHEGFISSCSTTPNVESQMQLDHRWHYSGGEDTSPSTLV